MATFEDDVRLVRRDGFAVMAGALGLSGLAATSWLLLGRPGSIALDFGVFAWLGAGMMHYICVRVAKPSRTPVRVHLDANGLFIDRVRFAAPGEICGGWVQPGTRSCVVHLQRLHGPVVRLLMGGSEQGRALLRAAGVDANQMSACFWALARPFGEPRSYARAALIVSFAVASGVCGAGGGSAALAAAVLALVASFAALSIPTRVCVGADGFLLRWVGTVRFVPWRRVVAMERFDGGILTAIEGGEWLTVRLPFDHEGHHPEGESLFERMRAAWPRSSAPALDDPAIERVRRRDRSMGDWVTAMRLVLGTGAEGERRGGYRAPAPVLSRDGAWRLVEDARLDREARVGAALVLSQSLDARGRARLGAIIEGSVEPALRLALMAIAARRPRRTDQQMAAALQDVEAESVSTCPPR